MSNQLFYRSNHFHINNKISSAVLSKSVFLFRRLMHHHPSIAAAEIHRSIYPSSTTPSFILCSVGHCHHHHSPHCLLPVFEQFQSHTIIRRSNRRHAKSAVAFTAARSIIKIPISTHFCRCTTIYCCFVCRPVH